MNSLQNLIQRLSNIGQVTEAEEKCPDCGCTPCECDEEKVDESKKPDADKDGIPDWADKDEEKVDEGAMDTLKAMGKKALDTLGHGDDEDLIKDMQKKAGLPQTGKKPGQEEEVKETALNLLRRYAGIQETKIEEDDVAGQVGSDNALAKADVAEGSGDPEITPGMKTPYGTVVKVNGNTVTVKASNGELTTMNIHDIQQGVAEDEAQAKVYSTPTNEAEDETGEEAGKKYKVNECGEMSPMTMTGQEQPHMGIPAEVMAHMAGQEQGPEMAEPEMAEPEAPKATYTLNISNGDNNLSMTTDVPDEIIHIMKLAGVNQGAEVSKKEMPADGEQEVEESGYENTPDNTRARDPQAHGDIRDWGQKGTANAKTHYTPAQSGDNPMNEQRMFDDYKNFKAGK